MSKDKKEKPTRAGFGDGLIEAGKRNPDVVALCCDLTESTRIEGFKNEFPDRYFEVGVAEQNLAGIGAGLALSGKIPFIASYAVFSPGRNWDQTRVSICYSQANVKTVGAHAGLSVGPDGATHQALEDIAITRVLPNMTVVVPCDYDQAVKATIAIAEHKGPSYIRLGRSATPIMTDEKTEFKIGKAHLMREGKDLTIVSCGPIISEVLEAVKDLNKVSVEVINMHTIKPIDRNALVKSAKKTGKVVTVEEHQVHGGLGSAVCEVLAQEHPVPVRIVGVRDTFGESGDPYELWHKYKIDRTAIKETVKSFM